MSFRASFRRSGRSSRSSSDDPLAHLLGGWRLCRGAVYGCALSRARRDPLPPSRVRCSHGPFARIPRANGRALGGGRASTHWECGEGGARDAAVCLEDLPPLGDGIPEDDQLGSLRPGESMGNGRDVKRPARNPAASSGVPKRALGLVDRPAGAAHCPAGCRGSHRRGCRGHRRQGWPGAPRGLRPRGARKVRVAPQG